jgi:predicted alpha-1,6-mannanase (GH76 family)
MRMKLLHVSALLLGSCFASPAAVQVGDDFNAHSATAAKVLQEQWYNRQGLWSSTDWWNAANCVESLQSVIVAQNGGPYLDVLNETFRRNAGRNFLNEFYDDEGWWALAWIRAFDLTGERRYLDMARTIFTDMTGGWDSHCEGGIWWKKDRRYKNAIANELFLLVAVKLHQRTPGDQGPGSYLDWARREWEWFRGSGMINSEHLINDGLTSRCRNNGQTTWTYNQGVILGALTEFYKATGDRALLEQAERIADAALEGLTTPAGVLREVCEPDDCGGADVPQFKGIFARYLADLHDVTRKPAYYNFLLTNARSIWAHNRDSSNRFGLRWTGPIDTVDAARHSSAMVPLAALAEPMTSALGFIKPSGGPAFNHEVGEATGVLAWRCHPTNTAGPGLMQSGPFLESLGTGPHTVGFEIAVDAVDASPVALVRLDVRDDRSGTVLARREVAWNAFKAAGRSQRFDLMFTNPPGAALEFRVHWHHAPESTGVTVTDVSVSDERAWTAANLIHEVGQLDGANLWCADPVRNPSGGVLARGEFANGTAAGKFHVQVELKVDNFNLTDAHIATLKVVELESGRAVASRAVKRRDFRTTLFHTLPLSFDAEPGKLYEVQTLWHPAPGVPRLTQRSVILRPPSGATAALR